MLDPKVIIGTIFLSVVSSMGTAQVSIAETKKDVNHIVNDVKELQDVRELQSIRDRTTRLETLEVVHSGSISDLKFEIKEIRLDLKQSFDSLNKKMDEQTKMLLDAINAQNKRIDYIEQRQK